jgi:hypothetical protein
MFTSVNIAVLPSHNLRLLLTVHSNLSGWTERFGVYLHKNQQMHQNYHFIVTLNQMLLHVSAHQRHHQGAQTILTSYLSVYITERIMEYRVKQLRSVILYCECNCIWLTVAGNSGLFPATVNHIHLHPQCKITNWSHYTRYSIILSVMYTDK